MKRSYTIKKPNECKLKMDIPVNLVNDIKNAIEEKKFGQSIMLAVNPRKF